MNTISRTRLQESPKGRRTSLAYRAKKRIVRDIWIGTALLMLLLPHPGAVATLALFTTFLSFTILDETA